MWLWEGVEASQRCGERRLSLGVRRVLVRCEDGGRVETDTGRTGEGCKARVGALEVEAFGSWIQGEDEVRVEFLIS